MCEIDLELFFQDINFIIQSENSLPFGDAWREAFPNLLENPWSSEGGATYHHGIHPIALKGKPGFFGCGDVTVSDNRDMDAGITFHFPDERPVGLSRIHLTAGAPVDGERLNATVLQLFGQCGDDELFLIPSQTGFHSDGRIDGLHHFAGNIQKQFRFL